MKDEWDLGMETGGTIKGKPGYFSKINIPKDSLPGKMIEATVYTERDLLSLEFSSTPSGKPEFVLSYPGPIESAMHLGILERVWNQRTKSYRLFACRECLMRVLVRVGERCLPDVCLDCNALVQ
jgi:hypothetical protein